MTDLLTQHITFFIQLANFLIVLAILNPLLIKPIRKIIQARKEAAAALLGESESFFQSAEGKLAQYEKALSAAREEALQRFVLRESNFTGDVSHELRTPLTVMQGGLEILEL